MPKQSKNTFTTTFRGNITDVATIARWMKSKGFIPRSRNELINQAVINFANHIRTSYSDLGVHSVTDAITYLNESGLTDRKDLVPALLEEMQNEALVSGGSSPLDTTLSTKATKKHSELAQQTALSILKRAQEREQSDKQTLEQLKHVARQNMPVLDSNSSEK